MFLLKFLKLPKKVPRFNLAPFKESPKVDYLLFYKGVICAKPFTQKELTAQPKIHEFTLKRINKRSDLSNVFPISSSAIKTLYATQATTQRKIVFSRFLGLQFESSNRYYKLDYSLTHTLVFGYWLNPDTFIQILKLSFNVNPIAKILTTREGDKLAIDTVLFLIHQMQAYDSKIVDGKLVQHSDLTSLSAENRLLWFLMLFEQHFFIQNGERV